MEIYIARHGLSEGNAKRIFQGWIDFPLDKEGRKQAAHLGRYFSQQGVSFERIVSSSLLRARETAEIIHAQQDNPPEIEIEENFKEIQIGQLEGVNASEAQQRFPSYYKRPPSGWLDFEEFGGESWDSLSKRISDAMPKYVDESKLLEDGKVLIVAHGASMRAILRNLLQIDNGMMFIRVENCSHFKVNFVETRGYLRRYIEYFMPLTSLLVDGEPYVHLQDDSQRMKSEC